MNREEHYFVVSPPLPGYWEGVLGGCGLGGACNHTLAALLQNVHHKNKLQYVLSTAGIPFNIVAMIITKGL